LYCLDCRNFRLNDQDVSTTCTVAASKIPLRVLAERAFASLLTQKVANLRFG
jgi:hypothetical protein